MHRIWLSVMLLSTFALASDAHKAHSDYVPDKKAAERIAQAVLEAQYGEEFLVTRSPLNVDGSNKDYWIVQVSSGRPNEIPAKGGGPALWINKHSGCLRLMEYMK
jgi:NTF2 fold immunity protein